MGQVNTHLLTVLTGLNAGARVKLPAGNVTLGGAADDDIVLDGFDRTALELTLGKDAARVMPRIDGVGLEDAAPGRAGEASRAALPCMIQLDDSTSVHVCRLSAERRKRPMGTMLLFFLCLVGALVLASAQIEFRTPVPANARTALPEPLPASAPAPEVQRAAAVIERPTCVDCESEAAAFLQAEIAEAGLVGLVAEPADGALRVTGSYAPAMASRWRQIRRAYDQRWSNHVPLIPALTEAISDPPIRVASVWLGEPREIVTETGQSFQIGETVKDGWVVEGIETGYVLLIRGATSARIDF